MIKILFASRDNKHINEVRTVCARHDFELETISVFEPLNLNTESLSLIIIDISGPGTVDNDFYSDFFAKLNNYSAARLLMLDTDQAPLALEIRGSILKFDGIIFSDRIEKELYTRIAVLLPLAGPEKKANCIYIGSLILNLDKYELSIDGKSIELTFKEYELLKLFLENPNKVFSRNKLLSLVWGYDFYGGSRTVDVHMRRLRSKLVFPYIDMLKTVRNVGYMFSPG